MNFDLKKVNQVCDQEAPQIKNWMTGSQTKLSESDLTFFAVRVMDSLGYHRADKYGASREEYFSVLDLVKEKLHFRVSVQL